MPPWLLDAWHKADAWTTDHSVWTVLVGSIFSIVVILLTARVLSNIAAKLVVRRVFGADRVQLPAESMRQVTQAQAEAARVIAEQQREITEEIGRMHATMQTEIRAMLETIRNGSVPLTIAVSTREERQTLEALIMRERPAPRIVTRRRTQVARVDGQPIPPAPEQEETAPTAWERILLEDDEDGTPCPTPTTTEPTPEPQSPPQPPKAAKKTAKPRAPKKAKG